MEEVKIHGVYRHYHNQHLYVVLTPSAHLRAGVVEWVDCVVYTPLEDYNNLEKLLETVYVRTVEDFTEEVGGVVRFAYIGQVDDPALFLDGVKEEEV